MAAAYDAARCVGAAALVAGLVLLAGGQAWGEPAGDGPADSRVWPMDPAARTLIAQARAASPTVAFLLSRIDASDVIVKVSVTLMNDGLAGDLRFLAATACARILCVRIDRLRAPPEQMSWLGHELQHAVEVAGAPAVRSEADLVTLMQRIGRSRGQGRLFETDAAVACGRQVAREVAAGLR